ncbi:MAG: hypothetical protein B6I28_00470 [Fusobacteriia bacterium 4572_132]|nr:MAG: hypothetical protein B6I28_00470 [Fusobacteriia bacterium 4572_132]
MKKRFVETLYDAASNEDGSFNQEKLNYELKQAERKMGKAKWNKQVFEENEPKFATCNMYDPCPICDKCKNKASHLYVRCQTCKIPTCTHTYQDKIKMIRRENFEIKASSDSDLIKLILEKEKEILGG